MKTNIGKLLLISSTALICFATSSFAATGTTTSNPDQSTATNGQMQGSTMSKPTHAIKNNEATKPGGFSAQKTSTKSMNEQKKAKTHHKTGSHNHKVKPSENLSKPQGTMSNGMNTNVSNVSKP